MYHVIFEKATGNVIQKGRSAPTAYQGDPDHGVLSFEIEPRPPWASINREHLVVDDPASASPTLREMTQAEKDALKAEKEAELAAFEQAKKDGELAILDSLTFSEEFARTKGTAEAVVQADRILAEVNRRKAELGVA